MPSLETVLEERQELIDSMRARIATLEAALRGLLLSADAAWEHTRAGHDWPEACETARAALSPGGTDG